MSLSAAFLLFAPPSSAVPDASGLMIRIFLLAVTVWMYWKSYGLAKVNGRRWWVWFLVTFPFGPVVPLLGLLAIDAKRRASIRVPTSQASGPGEEPLTR